MGRNLPWSIIPASEDQHPAGRPHSGRACRAGGGQGLSGRGRAAGAHPRQELVWHCSTRRGAAHSDVRRQRKGLRFTRRCQCGPCDLDGLCDSLCHLDARLFGVVPPLKHERKNRLRTLVEDVEAIARVGHLNDIAHRAVPVAEARQCLSPGSNRRPAS